MFKGNLLYEIKIYLWNFRIKDCYISLYMFGQITFRFLWMLSTFFAIGHYYRKPVEQSVSNSCQLLWLTFSRFVGHSYGKKNKKNIIYLLDFFSIILFMYLLMFLMHIFHLIYPKLHCIHELYVYHYFDGPKNEKTIFNHFLIESY